MGQVIYLGQRRQQKGFTPRDLLELERWAGPGRRSMICQGDGEAFAMLYCGVQSWASWGVVREGAEVTLWNCVTFANLGQFASMCDALAAIPGKRDAPRAPLSNIIALMPSSRANHLAH